MRYSLLGALCALLLAPLSLLAQEADAGITAEQFVDSLQFRHGDFALPAANATMHVGEKYFSLGAEDAQRVLEQLWGNPPDDSVLGMIVANKSMLTDEHGWAVVLTYSPDGYVSDEDAAEIDYAEMLKDMQASTEAANEQREQQGYGRIQLVNWAMPPSYDATQKKLHWAKQLSFNNDPDHTLNYDVRALGRHGYLSMNAVAKMQDLEAVKLGMSEVMQMAAFNDGARYADYQPGSDKVAGYGLAALVGGAVAAKTGLLGKLFVALLAAKKLVIGLLIAAALGLKGLLNRKKQDSAAG